MRISVQTHSPAPPHPLQPISLTERALSGLTRELYYALCAPALCACKVSAMAPMQSSRRDAPMSFDMPSKVLGTSFPSRWSRAASRLARWVYRYLSMQAFTWAHRLSRSNAAALLMTASRGTRLPPSDFSKQPTHPTHAVKDFRGTSDLYPRPGRAGPAQQRRRASKDLSHVDRSRDVADAYQRSPQRLSTSQQPRRAAAPRRQSAAGQPFPQGSCSWDSRRRLRWPAAEAGAVRASLQAPLMPLGSEPGKAAEPQRSSSRGVAGGAPDYVFIGSQRRPGTVVGERRASANVTRGRTHFPSVLQVGPEACTGESVLATAELSTLSCCSCSNAAHRQASTLRTKHSQMQAQRCRSPSCPRQSLRAVPT